MAVTRTGTTLRIVGNPASDSDVYSVTVPSDATFMLVGLTTAKTTFPFFSLASVTFTKGGIDTAMTFLGGEDSGANAMCVPLWSMALPDTGVGLSLKYDWTGTSSVEQDMLWSITFWKGVDTSSPVRDAQSVTSATAPYSTPTLTAVSGDLIVAYAGAFVTAEGSVDSWTNLSLLDQVTFNGFSDSAWGTGSPSGNTTVSVATVTNWGGGGCGMVAVVLKASGGTVLIGDRILDVGLSELDTLCDKVFVCGASPTSYSDATSGANSLGSKNWGAGAAFGSPAARSGGGRQITSTAITDGSISTAGTVAYWAAVDSANSRLLASGSLSGGKAVTVGQVFTLGAMTFGIPNT
jgi:hypothetical protein